MRLFTIPNILTLANLACGFAAIYVTLIEKNLTLAFILIIAGAILDFFDGFAAKMLKSYSALGKELDSLADVVSFGVAPAFIVMSILTSMESDFAPVAVVIALFSALRLAKFNVDENQTSEFIGLPTPANAIFFASIGWMFENGSLLYISQWQLIAATLIMSYMLISNVKMFALKFKSYALKGNYIRYGFLLISLIALIIGQVNAFPLIILAYIVISILSNLLCKGE